MAGEAARTNSAGTGSCGEAGQRGVLRGQAKALGLSQRADRRRAPPVLDHADHCPVKPAEPAVRGLGGDQAETGERHHAPACMRGCSTSRPARPSCRAGPARPPSTRAMRPKAVTAGACDPGQARDDGASRSGTGWQPEREAPWSLALTCGLCANRMNWRGSRFLPGGNGHVGARRPGTLLKSGSRRAVGVHW
jgi:hypothetical protein